MKPRAILILATVGVAALVIPPIVFAPLHASSAPNRDFDSVVSALEPGHCERLFRTAAYVGGPAEIAYHAQIGPSYAHFGIPRPALAASRPAAARPARPAPIRQ